MPKWLQQMMAPTLALWLCAIAFGVALGMGSEGMPKRAELASSVALPLVVASWVTADARKRGRRLCYDYDSFVYFAWFVVVPIYLFQTRGARAFITLLCFAAMWLVTGLSAGLVFLLRELVL